MREFGYAILVVLLVWTVWIQIGHGPEWANSDPALDQMQIIQTDSVCLRNVVGIQPYMVSSDYQSKQHFYEKLKTYFEAAKQGGYFTKNTVVLLPEYLGTWLVINDEKSSVAEAKTITGAMTLIVLSNPIQFSRSYFSHQNESDVVAASIFRMKSQAMATIYSEVFKELAKTYQVTIDAGSIVLPGPLVVNSEIKVYPSQPLYNTSFIFHPTGDIDSRLIRKSFPISSEIPFVTAYPIEELPIFDLPIGKTAVLVCADSWYPESYDRINQLNADVVLVSSYCAGNNTMVADWKGYDGIRMPGDVDSTDVKKLKERDAWVKYALPGRINKTQAAIGVNVFLRGELWDLGTDGQPFFIKDGQLLEIGKSERGGIWSLCF
ncbi:MAG: nitrilase-related carbon-nitrogen hydrolase [Cyclobacteriaceae bacterium]